jgi:hypothetical protein
MGTNIHAYATTAYQHCDSDRYKYCHANGDKYCNID